LNNLEVLNLSFNQLEEFEEIKKLNHLSKLKELILVGNNFQFSHSEKEFSSKIKSILPQVMKLDGLDLNAEFKKEPENSCELKQNYSKFESNAFLDLIISLKSENKEKIWKDIKIFSCCNTLNNYFKHKKGFEMNDAINGPNNWNVFVGEIFSNFQINCQENKSINSLEKLASWNSSKTNKKYSIINTNVFLKFRMGNLASLDLTRFQKEIIKEVNLDFNRFKEIPKVLLNLPNLEKLSMIKNKIMRLSFDSPNNSLVILLLGNNKIYRMSDLKVKNIIELIYRPYLF
jgi:Leucine-rich repeat (LRR) protein